MQPVITVVNLFSSNIIIILRINILKSNWCTIANLALRNICCILCIFLCTHNSAFAQRKITSVNPLTGSANVNIPIITLGNGSASLPIGLYYLATGVRVKDVEGKPGMGWQLNAGGQISRTLRGLPDDCKKDAAGNTKVGWLYNSNAAKINNFTIQNDNNTATCNDDVQDVNYINTNFGDNSDTEPDVFTLTAPGLSFQFVFDGNHVIQPLSYQDVKITYIADPTSGQITSFVVTNNQGIKYTF